MGRLYIANCTPMRQTVTYRLDIDKNGDFSDRMRSQSFRQEIIEPGKQVTIAGDLHPAQMTQIIDQLTVYGLVGAVDVPNRLRGVAPLVFNIDIPTPRHILETVVAHNRGIKVDDGTERRKRAAIAANQALVQQTGDPVPVFEVEYEQETVSEFDESPIEEGFKVVPDKKGPPPPSKPRKAG